MSHTVPNDPAAETALTPSQRHIWTGQRLHPDVPLYNMAFAFRFPAVLDPERFRTAWRRVVADHAVLRSAVATRDGEPVARARAMGAAFDTALRDFGGEPDPAAAFRAWSRDRARRPLPLDGPLVDSVLARLGGDGTGWFLNQHHLVTDAWSTVLLYRQVAAEYAALAGGGDRPAPLAPYPASAAARRTTAAARRAAATHWAARRGDGPRVTPVYGRAARPGSTASTRLTGRLTPTRRARLDRLAASDVFPSLSPSVSRFALLATATLGWLDRISGGEGGGFDAPVAGRSGPAAKRALGPFIELFPFQAPVAPGDTFRSLGRRCLEETERLLLHGLPGTSAPSAATGHDVVVNYVPGTLGPFAGLPVDVEWIHPGHGDSVHALRLQIHDFGGTGGYTLHLDGNDDGLPDRLRRRGLAHFERMLGALVDDPDRPIATVDLETPEERRDRATLNATGVHPPPHRSVVELVAAQAAATPERVAVRQGGRSLTYARLADAVAAVADRLADDGVEAGEPVPIVARRSLDTVVGLLGILAARGAYVPIDPLAPPARVETILRDTGARLLLHDRADHPVPPALAAAVETRAIGGARGRGSASRPDPPPRPRLDQLAYILYTSGSTGAPKGVLVEHGGLADYLTWAARRYVRGDRLVVPLFTSLAFDLTVTSLFLPLITGGTLEVYPAPDGPADTALADVVAADAADLLKLTPSHLTLLLQLDPPRLRARRLIVGGEDLKTRLAAAVLARFGDDVEIYNEYGPTEAVVGCVMHRYDPARDRAASVPIGAPADHVEIRIVNEAGIDVPEGVPGELWVSRFGLARGYHRRDALTADRFVTLPATPPRRAYRTGDRVRLRDPSTLEYLGRLDRQLKIAGIRVEPGEVEAVALAVPGIEQCAVVARRRPAPAGPPDGPGRTCVRCTLPEAYPGADLDDAGVCRPCRTFASIADAVRGYFGTMDDLRARFAASARTGPGGYDCLLLLSGGKDSTYALARLVEMGLGVYAFSLDNGYISEQAKTNMRRVTAALGVPLELATTPAMPAIFRDSLERYSNVCHGCFKTIYTLSLQRARALGIPIIVTGLSRGQLFETRLDAGMFRPPRSRPDEVDAAVLEARKAYHRTDDAVARLLDVRMFDDDRVFDEVAFVDFYRYCDVGLDAMLDHLARATPWVRPDDTGRSTNCRINDVGIYVHTRERGYHNYALPYSWDVRLGHKAREAALEELRDTIDLDRVEAILGEIGYTPRADGPAPPVAPGRTAPVLAAFYVTRASTATAARAVEDALWTALRAALPPPIVPAAVTRVEAIPLTPHGKVDERALPGDDARPGAAYVAPDGPVEAYLAAEWAGRLGLDRVGAADDFFALGGTSLAAMEIMIRLCREYDLRLPLHTLLEHRTLRALAQVTERAILDDPADRR